MLCLMLLASCFTANAAAAIVPPAEPLWDNAHSVTCAITLSGTRGTIQGRILGYLGTTSIAGTLTLYENGVEMESWNISSTTVSANVLDNFTATRGCTYDLVLNAVVTTNGVSEQISASDTATCT